MSYRHKDPRARGQVDDTAYFAVLTELADDDEMITAIVERGLAKIPTYAQVPTESIVNSVKRNRALAIQTLRTRILPEHVWEASLSTRERLEQGVQIEDIILGFREVLKEIQRFLIARSERAGIPSEAALEASTLLWDLGDIFTAQITVAYREIQMEKDLARHREREDWVGGVLDGSLSPAERQRGIERFGSPGTAKAIISSPIAGPAGFSMPDTTILSQGRIVGYLPTDVHLPENVDYSEGPTVQFENLHKSYPIAVQIQAAAELTGIGGRVNLDKISWRLTVPMSIDLYDSLKQRYVDPLVELGEFGESIIESVRAYLTHDRKTRAAARTIPIHVNTLRYRLQKFEEITTCSLDSTETVIELSWMLARFSRRFSTPKTQIKL